jgi:hypothetical protein
MTKRNIQWLMELELKNPLKRAKRTAKRTSSGRPGIDLWPREQMCLDKVHEDLEARKALKFLSQKCDLTEKMLIAKTVQLAWTPIVLTDDKYRMPAQETTETPEALLEFSAKLYAAAKKVIKLNEDKFWQMKIPVPSVFPERLQRRRRLPGKQHRWAVSVSPYVFREGVEQFEGFAQAPGGVCNEHSTEGLDKSCN